MSAEANRTSAQAAGPAADRAADPALLPRWVMLSSMTLPGRAEHVREVRRFITRMVGGDACADVAILLTSEVVTNAVVHSRSRLPGGTVKVVAARNEAGLLVTVTDNGSDSGVPVVTNGQAAGSGNGLLLVDELADTWGYLRDSRRTTVWFRLCSGERMPCNADRGLLHERTARISVLSNAKFQTGRTLAACRRARSR